MPRTKESGIEQLARDVVETEQGGTAEAVVLAPAYLVLREALERIARGDAGLTGAAVDIACEALERRP